MPPEDMSLSVNGHSEVPPGFRFHPTEEELLQYYLRKKVASEKIDLDVIRDVDLNKLEPWDIQEKCKIGSTPQNDWYFFSHKDKKYPSGTRTNRATAAGFWKATGRDKVIRGNFRRIGMRKTLVFYRGRAPHGQKSDWFMHEYRLDDNTIHDSTSSNGSNIGGDQSGTEGWVVCRVFKKKTYHKALESPLKSSPTTSNEGVLDQILMYMGRSSISSNSSGKQEMKESSSNTHQYFPNQLPAAGCFLYLPGLMENPTSNQSSSSSIANITLPPVINDHHLLTEMEPLIPTSHDWVALDRLVTSQLDGPDQTINEEDFSFFFDHDHVDQVQFLNMHHSDRTNDYHHQVSTSETTDLWNFARSSSSLSSSSSNPLCHLSV